MSRRAALVLLAATGTLLAAACSSATTSARPGGPAPTGPGGNPPAPSGGGVHGPTVAYKPLRSASYSFERHDTLTLQLPGGATQEQLLDRTGFLHLSVTANGGSGYLATIVLDSLRATAGGVPVATDSIMRAQGTRWTATLTPSGQLSELKADRSSSLGDQLSSGLRALFPQLPAGGARAGMVWTDTSRYQLRADAFDATEDAITSYRASEGESAAGRKTLRLESEGTYSRAGKGMQFDQELQMSASGRRQAIHLLDTDGVLVSARGTDAGEMTITVPAVGQTVPVKQHGSFTVVASSAPSR